jgi:hypothetical protein
MFCLIAEARSKEKLDMNLSGVVVGGKQQEVGEDGENIIEIHRRYV